MYIVRKVVDEVWKIQEKNIGKKWPFLAKMGIFGQKWENFRFLGIFQNRPYFHYTQPLDPNSKALHIVRCNAR